MGFVQNIPNNINFHYRTKSVKINDPIFSLFLPISPISGAKKVFPKYLVVRRNFIRVFSTITLMEKSNWWSNSKKTSGQTEGQIDPILQDLSGYHWRYKYNCNRLTFKNQRYRVRCCFNKKLLHHNQDAKNQLSS